MTSPAAQDGEPAFHVPPRRARRTLGAVLIALGLVGILWGVFHVLNAIGGYESRDFAHRKRDYEVRKTVQEHFPGALLRGLAGLGLVLLGARVRSGGERERADDPVPDPPQAR